VATIQQLSSLSEDLSELTLVGENFYIGKSRTKPGKTYYVVHASKPSYGGPMQVAALVDEEMNVIATAVLSSSDTDSYLQKVVGLGTLETFIDQQVDALPEVDTVS
jgi:hypothetical protein